MCDEYADPYSAIRRTSRKERTCGECGRTIDRGEAYWAIGARWDGDWHRFSFCLFCEALRDVLEDVWDDCIPLGGLAWVIKDGCDIEVDERPLLEHFFPRVWPGERADLGRRVSPSTELQAAILADEQAERERREAMRAHVMGGES